jgi:hypothetical protein
VQGFEALRTYAFHVAGLAWSTDASVTSCWTESVTPVCGFVYVGPVKCQHFRGTVATVYSGCATHLSKAATHARRSLRLDTGAGELVAALRVELAAGDGLDARPAATAMTTMSAAMLPATSKMTLLARRRFVFT